VDSPDVCGDEWELISTFGAVRMKEGRLSTPAKMEYVVTLLLRRKWVYWLQSVFFPLYSIFFR
jgi:hypothetical protein